MVSLENSFSDSTRFPLSRNFSSSSATSHRHVGRSMRTVRSNLYRSDNSCSSFPDHLSEKTESRFVSENLTDSVVEMRLGELAARYSKSSGGGKSVKSTSSVEEDFLEMSRAFSDFSACSSDISGELQRLAGLPSSDDVEAEENSDPNAEESEPEPEPCHGFLQRESFSTEIMENISPEDLQPTVKLCIDGLQSASVAVKRSAAAKLRLLAKDRCENRALIGDSGAIPALVPLLRCSDPATQENAVTALLNLSLYGENKQLITEAGAIKSLIYALRTGTEISKQNAACALLSLAMIEENKSSIGACGAVPPLVSLLLNGSSRGKKDALTTLYKLCSVKVNKERAVNAGAVRPLVDMVAEQGNEMAEKAMVVLNSLAGIVEGREAIVEEDGIPALVEAIEDGSMKGKEFAVLALLQLCAENVKNRGLLVREGGIPPLVALSETGNLKMKRKAEKLLGYLRESRNGASSSTP